MKYNYLTLLGVFLLGGMLLFSSCSSEPDTQTDTNDITVTGANNGNSGNSQNQVESTTDDTTEDSGTEIIEQELDSDLETVEDDVDLGSLI